MKDLNEHSYQESVDKYYDFERNYATILSPKMGSLVKGMTYTFDVESDTALSVALVDE